MQLTKSTTLAKDFFDAYTDPEISKRLFFDVWAERNRLNVDEKERTWHAVICLTAKAAARKRNAARLRAKEALLD